MNEGCVDCGCPLDICCGQNRKKYVPVSEHEAFKEKVRRAVIVQRNLDGSIITHINKRALCYVDLKLIKELGLSEKVKE